MKVLAKFNEGKHLASTLCIVQKRMKWRPGKEIHPSDHNTQKADAGGGGFPGLCGLQKKSSSRRTGTNMNSKINLET